jgi:hypothetical protein
VEPLIGNIAMTVDTAFRMSWKVHVMMYHTTGLSSIVQSNTEVNTAFLALWITIAAGWKCAPQMGSLANALNLLTTLGNIVVSAGKLCRVDATGQLTAMVRSFVRRHRYGIVSVTTLTTTGHLSSVGRGTRHQN